MSADDLCVLSHLVTRAGGSGLEEFDIGPEGRNTTSHAQRHVKSILVNYDDVRQPNLFKLEVPMNEKRASIRLPGECDIRLPHEAIIDGFGDIQADQVDSFWADNPSFSTHPVVVDALSSGWERKQIVPVSLYWDGVQYTKNDTFMGFYCENMFTKTKYMLCILRSKLREPGRPCFYV